MSQAPIRVDIKYLDDGSLIGRREGMTDRHENAFPVRRRPQTDPVRMKPFWQILAVHLRDGAPGVRIFSGQRQYSTQGWIFSVSFNLLGPAIIGGHEQMSPLPLYSEILSPRRAGANLTGSGRLTVSASFRQTRRST